ncbi:hypothetical protein Pcinc_025347 [Petrolisthes cinctipes]|uniref:Uncharacterized protein n=1 Tax=Petrolisthes cinctipes TaxID=88211 RepID=A0AAE1FA45_PETCI|nr:hypothetical protein Pcinc_025347 [Petrolisthes cinctipes]
MKTLTVCLMVMMVMVMMVKKAEGRPNNYKPFRFLFESDSDPGVFDDAHRPAKISGPFLNVGIIKPPTLGCARCQTRTRNGRCKDIFDCDNGSGGDGVFLPFSMLA